MVRSSRPPAPRMARTRPLVGARSLLAEHASWRLHREMRGRDFEDEKAVRRFLESHRDVLHTPLPADASPADRAQELFYLSREAESHVIARRMREDALQADPENVDVLVDRAIFDTDFGPRLARMEEAVALGNARLAAADPRADDEERGWSVLSDRPGLRARAALALQLVEVGRLEGAIDSCTELLKLDPSDNLGARYLHVALLLEVGRHEEARRMLAAHGGESCAIFAWAAVLLEWATGGDAEAALEVARTRNGGVEEALLEPEMLDVPPPELHEAGSSEEAEIVSDLLWRAWYRHPAAIDWLRDRTHDHLRDTPEVPVWERILEADDERLRRGLLPFLLPPTEATLARLRELVAELRRLGAASAAVPELVAYLRRRPSVANWTSSEALQTLSGLGASVVRPLLVAYAEEPDPDVRYDLADALAGTGVRDEEILAVLREQLQANTALGAGLFMDHGDERALPFLSERLDQADPDPKNHAAGVPDLIEAIEELGGSLSPRQQERFAKFIERRARWETTGGRRELEDAVLRITQRGAAQAPGPDADRDEPLVGFGHGLPLPPPAETVLSRPDRPGRNEPCWCGSGRKYKRCHLDDDGAETP